MMVNKCFKFQSNISNGFEKNMVWYKTLNQNSKSKKGHNSYKNLDRVINSCLVMEEMMVNKYYKFEGKICNSFENKRAMMGLDRSPELVFCH